MITEIQLKQVLIDDWNQHMDGHNKYKYFRSMLKGNSRELNSMLERAFTFFDEARGVPVLLSMLVLVFRARKDRKATSEESLPADKEARSSHVGRVSAIPLSFGVVACKPADVFVVSLSDSDCEHITVHAPINLVHTPCPCTDSDTVRVNVTVRFT